MDSKTYKKILRTTDTYVTKLIANGFISPYDLLRYFPRTYEDRRQIKTLDLVLTDDTTQVVKGKIVKKSLIRTPRGKRLTEIVFVDEKEQPGVVRALNAHYLIKKAQKDSWFYIIGKPKLEGGKVTFWHADMIEAIDTSDLKGLVGCMYPVYSELQGIKPSRFAKKIPLIVKEGMKNLQDTYPASFYESHGLLPLRTMIELLHHPNSLEDATNAKKTLFFKRLLRVQLHSLIQKQTYQDNNTQQTSDQIDRDCIKEFLSHLPFTLTKAQKKALKEIVENIHEPKAMLRLLQGDVGSGKTIVATAVAWYVIKKTKGQVAFLAPIEVLANQHYKNLAKILLPLGVRIELLTGALKQSEKQRIKQSLQVGHIDIIVGTHAILQEDVLFDDLQFAVIDEQHKFGVRQRAFLQRHGAPHLLQMTATPIPRSMALAFFGEFEVSVIDEMPAGRKPIYTKIISEDEFIKLKQRVMTKIQQGQKIFLITPLIEESEAREDVKAATAHYQELKHLYSEIADQIGLLHGKIKSQEKEEIMKKFKDGVYTMLVSTTVIEVGIDIPEATVMIIYNAERFGLSQLHQLRGRVGRSDLQSYCFLETTKKSGDTYKRLKHMETTTDGFKLAEIDLQYRGPGEFLGTRQSGETDIPLEILTDTSFLKKVQDAAHDLLENHTSIVSKVMEGGELENMLV